MPMNDQETALEYLARVTRTSKNPTARTMATHALNEWNRFRASGRRQGLKTNRSLWDLIAGVLECHQNISHHVLMTQAVCGSDVFYFPIFKEAIARRAKSLTAANNPIVTGLRVESHRLPQTGKWGNVVCKT